MTEQEKAALLLKARDDYPPETVFNKVYESNGEDSGSSGKSYGIFEWSGDMIRSIDTKESGKQTDCGYIYNNKFKTWAKILYSPKPKNILQNLEIY